ncbi:MAG: hypothetical protein WC821_02090 [archaeon]|jgi:ribosomal protein S18 acetylase RimI-like enzyme
MPKVVVAKKFSKLSVSLKQKQRLGAPLIESALAPAVKVIPYYERLLFGTKGKKFKQRTFFIPEQKRLRIEITHKGKVVSTLGAFIDTYGKHSEATITWKDTFPTYERMGLATQMLGETLVVLKKAGVKSVKAHVINGRGIYRTLGFSEVHKFGETYMWKNL